MNLSELRWVGGGERDDYTGNGRYMAIRLVALKLERGAIAVQCEETKKE